MIVSIENLLKNISGEPININKPAKIPKIGAVKKNLKGANIGGAWSSESPLKFKVYRFHHSNNSIGICT